MTSPTLILTHPDCLDHLTPPGHPESPARLEAVLAALRAEPVLPLVWGEAPLACDQALLRVHPQAHLDGLAAIQPVPGHGPWQLIPIPACRQARWLLRGAPQAR